MCMPVCPDLRICSIIVDLFRVDSNHFLGLGRHVQDPYEDGTLLKGESDGAFGPPGWALVQHALQRLTCRIGQRKFKGFAERLEDDD